MADRRGITIPTKANVVKVLELGCWSISTGDGWHMLWKFEPRGRGTTAAELYSLFGWRVSSPVDALTCQFANSSISRRTSRGTCVRVGFDRAGHRKRESTTTSLHVPIYLLWQAPVPPRAALAINSRTDGGIIPSRLVFSIGAVHPINPVPPSGLVVGSWYRWPW